jgi:hypothetical protein
VGVLPGLRSGGLLTGDCIFFLRTANAARYHACSLGSPESAVIRKLSLNYAMELVAAIFAVLAIVGVLQTFIIGKHFIIPTMILMVAVLLGNLARYGYRDAPWAKQTLFWFGVIVTFHAFFALFWAKAYRAALGASFEYVCGAFVLLMAFLVFQFASRNNLFR